MLFVMSKTGKPGELDTYEPLKISNAVKKLELNHAIIIS